MAKRTKEIVITVRVSGDLATTAYRILSTALNQFKFQYARIEIKAPEITEEIRKK